MKAVISMGESFGKSRAGMTAGMVNDVAYFRARAVPKDRQTTDRNKVKVILGTTATNTHQLTSMQRSTWASIFGSITNSVAKFNSLNINRQRIGESINIAPPTVVEPPTPFYDISVQDLNVPEPLVTFYIPDDAATGMRLYVLSTGYVLPNVVTHSLNEMVQVAVLDAPVSGTKDISSNFFALFGSVIGKADTEESGIGFATRWVHVPSGRASEWYITHTEVVEV